MAHVHIVPFDLRRQLPKLKAAPVPVVEIEPMFEQREQGPELSFGEFQILLARNKPVDVLSSGPKGYKNSSAKAHRQLSQQEQHHFERVNYQNSVLGSVADEEVHLSAQSMVG